MTFRVNYIVANYIGPLRTYSHYQNLFKVDPLYFFKTHLNFLSTLDNKNNVYATFVFNDDINDNVRLALDEYKSDNFKIVYRKNSGFSYGIWNDAIKNDLENFDYFFLIEDDYIPTQTNFIDPFIERCKGNVAFVCGLVDQASCERFPGLVFPGDDPFSFPSISNGLLSAKACKEVYKKHNTIFKINDKTDYWSAYSNQIYFCKYFTDMGYRIVDTLDEFQSLYNNANAKDLVVYGQDKKNTLLTPIEVPRV